MYVFFWAWTELKVNIDITMHNQLFYGSLNALHRHSKNFRFQHFLARKNMFVHDWNSPELPRVALQLRFFKGLLNGCKQRLRQRQLLMKTKFNNNDVIKRYEIEMLTCCDLICTLDFIESNMLKLVFPHDEALKLQFI